MINKVERSNTSILSILQKKKSSNGTLNSRFKRNQERKKIVDARHIPVYQPKYKMFHRDISSELVEIIDESTNSINSLLLENMNKTDSSYAIYPYYKVNNQQHP